MIPPRCVLCPCDPGDRCAGGAFCDVMPGADDALRRRIRELAKAPVPVPTTSPVPLAGDLVAMATHRLGADRLARWVAAKIGIDCGCESRKIAMNRIDATLRRYLGLG